MLGFAEVRIGFPKLPLEKGAGALNARGPKKFQ